MVGNAGSLAAVPDWCTRRFLAWRVSITLEADFCIEAVEEALARHGTPEIFNTDQGSQFTSTDFINVLADREIRISMDGEGAWRDNVFVERIWRTIKYEEVYLRAYTSVSQARARIGRYLTFYNSRRHQSPLDGKTPDQASFNQPIPEAVAAEPTRKTTYKTPGTCSDQPNHLSRSVCPVPIFPEARRFRAGERGPPQARQQRRPPAFRPV